MFTILSIELFKIFRRPRTYISFAAIAAIVVLIQLAFYADGKSYMEFGLKALTQSIDVNGNVLSGYFICFIVLQTLLIHVPLLIALIGGDMIAGEANMGTLRLLMSKPVSRTELILAKFGATFIYTMLLLVWMAFLSLVVSLLIFGTGDLINQKSDSVHILVEKLFTGNDASGNAIYVNDVFWRYIAAFAFASIAMTAVAALSFLLSMFAENSIGPIVATMSIIIVFTILSSLDLPIFRTIHPYLFTSHMIGWKGFFEYPPGMSVDAYTQQVAGASWWVKINMYPQVLKSAGVLLLHVFMFLGISWLVFRKKDILS